MPRQLFEYPQGLRQPRSRWTVAVSTSAHLTIVCLLIIVPLVATDTLPVVREQLTTYIAADIDVPAPPPPAGSPRRVPASNTAAPTVAPTGIVDPPDVPDVPPGPPGEPSDFTGVVGVPTGVIGGWEPPKLQPLVEPPPPPQTPVRPGGDIRAPQRTTYVPPKYPPVALAARVEGDVILEAIIDATGAVRDVRVLRSVSLLDQAAIDAVRQWRYSPTRLNGVPVPIIMTVTVSFRLQ